jgi:hypothetical protein
MFTALVWYSKPTRVLESIKRTPIIWIYPGVIFGVFDGEHRQFLQDPSQIQRCYLPSIKQTYALTRKPPPLSQNLLLVSLCAQIRFGHDRIECDRDAYRHHYWHHFGDGRGHDQGLMEYDRQKCTDHYAGSDVLHFASRLPRGYDDRYFDEP